MMIIITIIIKLIRKTNVERFRRFDDRMSSKRRNLSALVFLINLITKVNLICIIIIIIIIKLTKKYLEVKIRSLRKSNSLKIYADNNNNLY